MEQKIMLITGASSGIGKETALTLAKQGHSLIIHGRNVQRTKEVYDEIIATTGNKNITMLTADLSLMAEVRKFADEVKSQFDHIDVLVNNAGGQFGSKRETTAEEYEKTLAINTLSPFLLTKLLMPLLKKSQSARVVTVSSESYRQGGKPTMDDINLERNYSLVRSYAQSKLFVWWLMRQFAVELEKKGIKNITVNTCEPGSAITRLQRISGKNPLMKIVGILWLPMMSSVKKAASTSIYLASSNEVEGKTGGFYGKCKEKNIATKWIDLEKQQQIWDYAMKETEQYWKLIEQKPIM